MKEQEELTYDEAADILRICPRHARRVLSRHGVKQIKRGYRTIRFRANDVFKLRLKLHREENRDTLIVHGHKYKLVLSRNGHTKGKVRR